MRATSLIPFLVVPAVGGCRAATPAAADAASLAPSTVARVESGRDDDDEAALRRVIARRRSVRTYSDAPLAHDDVLAVVWAAQGVTLSPAIADRVDGRGLRAAPSAGATFPLETYLVALRVDGLDPGLYHYAPATDRLEPVTAPADLAAEVTAACLGQRVVATAAAVVVFAAEQARTADRYGERAERYVMMEAGHACQNAHLMATARDLGACAIGAFEEARLAAALSLPSSHVPTYLLALGRPAETGGTR